MEYILLGLLVLIAVFCVFILVQGRKGSGAGLPEVIAKEIRETTGSLLDRLYRQLSVEFKNTREELHTGQSTGRKELTETLEVFRRGNQNAQKQLLDTLEIFRKGNEMTQKQLGDSVQALREKISQQLQENMRSLQESNEKKLDQMRETVDEKLHKTLETRLNQSFETVTKQLIEVQKGLSEMQTLAQDVGGLKRVLSNVKTRGVLGEAQLNTILEEFLTKDQYEVNVAVKPGSRENVEIAIKLPGGDISKSVWLPVDSKFPVEDYYRLMEAYEAGEKGEIDAQRKNLEKSLVTNARTISDKYIDPPNTTDFAIMFLPFEGLYAEALRSHGFFEKIQRDYKVTIVGPTNLVAFLNSLQVGFKTLAISRQSSEVWKVLGAVRTEFSRFGDSISSVQKNLHSASENLEKVSIRARQMEKKLKDTTSLPTGEAQEVLGIVYAEDEE